MKSIIFQFKGGQPNNVFNTPHGHFAVGDNIPEKDGTILISPDCRTISQLREQAEYLKKLIDEAVVMAEVHLQP